MHTMKLVGAAVVALASASALAQVNRDINSYVLFAQTDLSFKGRDADVTRGFIIGGNVGVNRIDPTPGDSNHQLRMGGGGSSHPVVMSPGTQVVSDSMALGGNDVTVWDMYANVWGNTNLQANRNSGPTAFTPAIVASLPSLGFTPNRVITNGALDYVLANGGSATLPVGTYRDVTVQNDGTLTLGAGMYDLRNLRCGQDVTIIVTDQTILHIDGEFSMGNDGFFGVGTQGLAQVFCGSYQVGANDASIHFSRRTEAHGWFYAPNGILNLGNHTDLFGRFWADQIGSDFNVNVTYTPTPGAAGLIALGGLVAARRRR
ncbi:MAG: hypothetical protein ACREJO_11415 [Phycisphaerales bacterium]